MPFGVGKPGWSREALVASLSLDCRRNFCFSAPCPWFSRACLSRAARALLDVDPVNVAPHDLHENRCFMFLVLHSNLIPQSTCPRVCMHALLFYHPTRTTCPRVCMHALLFYHPTRHASPLAHSIITCTFDCRSSRGTRYECAARNMFAGRWGEGVRNVTWVKS